MQKKFHLLNSLHEKVKKDLVLSSCGSADEIFWLLDSKYRNKVKIVLMITNEVKSLPPVKGNNPRRTIELIQAVAHSLESKLPSSLKREWILHKTDPANRFSPLNHFDCLLIFLKKQEKIFEELDQLEPSPLDKGAADYPYKGGGRLSLSPKQVRRTTIPAALSVEMTLMPASY